MKPCLLNETDRGPN